MQSDNSSQTHINSSVDQGIRSRTNTFHQVLPELFLEFRKRNYPVSKATFIHLSTLWYEWFDNWIWVDTTSMVSRAELHKSVSFLTFHPTICKWFIYNADLILHPILLFRFQNMIKNVTNMTMLNRIPICWNRQFVHGQFVCFGMERNASEGVFLSTGTQSVY